MANLRTFSTNDTHVCFITLHSRLALPACHPQKPISALAFSPHAPRTFVTAGLDGQLYQWSAGSAAPWADGDAPRVVAATSLPDLPIALDWSPSDPAAVAVLLRNGSVVVASIDTSKTVAAAVTANTSAAGGSALAAAAAAAGGAAGKDGSMSPITSAGSGAGASSASGSPATGTSAGAGAGAAAGGVTRGHVRRESRDSRGLSSAALAAAAAAAAAAALADIPLAEYGTQLAAWPGLWFTEQPAGEQATALAWSHPFPTASTTVLTDANNNNSNNSGNASSMSVATALVAASAVPAAAPAGPAGTYLAIGSASGGVRVWSRASGASLALAPPPAVAGAPVRQLVWSPASPALLLALYPAGQLVLYNAATGAVEVAYKQQPSNVASAVFVPTLPGAFLTSSTNHTDVTLWTTQADTPQETFPLFPRSPGTFAIRLHKRNKFSRRDSLYKSRLSW